MTTEEAIEYLTRCADGLDPDFDCAVSMAVSALRTQQNGGWISVKDRLPEEPEEEYPEYIVMIENARISTFLYYDGNGEWKDDCGIPYRVTHWQPLPKPPKGEKS